MAIRDLFVISETPTKKQIHWLTLCAAIPAIKNTLGNDVTEADMALANEAKDILNSIQSSQPLQLA